METTIGKVIDNYKIVDVLGKGGMGIVYKAVDMTLERDVALKLMDARIESDQNFLRRFQSEAKALAKLQNPNIVSIFALRETELGLCIVMEYVNGKTLAELIRRTGPLPIARTLHIFKQILTALGHAHKGGVIHRDIKPSNILLTDEDFVKITDFGLAKIQQTSSVTVTMGTGGTLYYMSPEQLKGLANVDQRGDIYSTGMTLYESLTARIPFQDPEADFTIRQAIVEGKIDPPDKMNPSIPKELVKVVMKSIDRDPDRRYQNAGEMWSALERFAASVHIAERATAEENTMLYQVPTPEPPPSLRKKLIPIIATGVAVLAVLAFFLRPLIFPPSTTISIKTSPSGSAVTINGKPVGDSPILEHHVQPGTVKIQVRQQNYIQKDTSLNLISGQSLTLSIPLLKKPELAERPRPDEKTSGKTDVVQPEEKGTVKSVIHPKGTKKTDVSTSSGSLAQEYAVGVNSNLPAIIVLNGKATDQWTPTTLMLKPGKYRITVSKLGYEVLEGEKPLTVESTTGKKYALKFTVRKK